MSATQVLVVLAVWVLIGLVTAVVMRRRGHHLFAWGTLGVLMGPLVIPLAISSVRSNAPSEAVIETGEPGIGPVDVLIAVDESPEATAAMYSAVELFAERLGRVALAAVLDYDTFGSTVSWDERDEALRELDRDGVEVSRRYERRPQTVLLGGRAGRGIAAIRARARLQRPRRRASWSHGASRALLGSVASQLARESRVPVLLTAPALPRPA